MYESAILFHCVLHAFKHWFLAMITGVICTCQRETDKNTLVSSYQHKQTGVFMCNHCTRIIVWNKAK